MSRGLCMRMLCVILLAAIAAGCTPQTRVDLVNSTPFPVDVELFYDDDQLAPEFLIEESGEGLNFTLQPGETQSFSRNCEDLQAIFIKDADMRIVLGISPEANTRVYREPDDFGCGNVLRFEFTANDLGTDLDINFSR